MGLLKLNRYILLKLGGNIFKRIKQITSQYMRTNKQEIKSGITFIQVLVKTIHKSTVVWFS